MKIASEPSIRWKLKWVVWVGKPAAQAEAPDQRLGADERGGPARAQHEVAERERRLVRVPGQRRLVQHRAHVHVGDVHERDLPLEREPAPAPGAAGREAEIRARPAM